MSPRDPATHERALRFVRGLRLWFGEQRNPIQHIPVGETRDGARLDAHFDSEGYVLGIQFIEARRGE